MVFPKSEDSTTAISKETINEDIIDGLPSDGRILAQSLAGKIKALTDDEGPPLTTKVIIYSLNYISLTLQAMRDLEAAQRARVYSHTLIKVK